MVVTQRKIYAIACDLSSETGEGFLANSLIKLVQTRFRVTIYTDPLVRALRSRPLLRDRFLPFYLFVVCLVLRLGAHRVLLLNYVPIWNFLNALLARCGVKLAPITGSVLVVPARASLIERFVRLHFQSLLITLSEWLLPRHSFIWCATPSVFVRLYRAGLPNLGFGFPYLNKITPISTTVKSYDLFIYSSEHPVKNHQAVQQFLADPVTRTFRICMVGKVAQSRENVSSFDAIPEEAFNLLLARSRLYLTFSFEDSGITGFKALANGIPVLCPRTSGLAFAVQYEESYCFDDPYDVDVIVSRASSLLQSTDEDQKKKLIKNFGRLKAEFDNTSIKWISSL